MKKVFEYSHLGGLEILKVRYPHIEQEIDEIIDSIKITSRTKISKEKTKMGKLLYSPTDMNKTFKKEFYKRGYEELKEFYNIDSYDAKHKIKAFKQIDFLKERVWLKCSLVSMLLCSMILLNSSTFTIKIRQMWVLR